MVGKIGQIVIPLKFPRNWGNLRGIQFKGVILSNEMSFVYKVSCDL